MVLGAKEYHKITISIAVYSPALEKDFCGCKCNNCALAGACFLAKLLHLSSAVLWRNIAASSPQSITILLSREVSLGKVSPGKVLQFYSPQVPAKVVTTGLQSWESITSDNKRFIWKEESRRGPASRVRNSSKGNRVQSLYRGSCRRVELSRVTLDWWIFVT